MSAFSKPFQDKNGKIVLFQSPNAPLVGWFLCTILARLFEGEPKKVLGALALIFLVSWCLLEIFKGATLFRRVLGLAVLTAAILARF